MKILKNKKGISLMISYVMLILISVTIAISLFAWLKLVANVEPVESCGDGTSMIVTDYQCVGKILKLTVKNNGRFNIDGFVLTVGNNTGRVPITPIVPLDDASVSVVLGQYIFKDTFKPEDSRETLFEGPSVSFSFIRNIRIQPFILVNSGDKIVCENSIIKQNLDNCQIKA